MTELTKMSPEELWEHGGYLVSREVFDELARRLAAAEAVLADIRPRIYYYDPEEKGIKVNRAPGWFGVTKQIDAVLAIVAGVAEPNAGAGVTSAGVAEVSQHPNGGRDE